jgi:hypothetical protein
MGIHQAALAVAVIGVAGLSVNARAQCKIAEFDTGLNSPVHHFEAEGSMLFLPADEQGLVILDVSDPTAPVEMSRYTSSGDAVFVDVVGSIAYLLTPDGLAVVDVSDPTAPAELGSIGLPQGNSVVAVSDGVAFVNGGSAGLLAIGINDPSQPALLGEVSEGNGFHVVTDGATAYTITNSYLKAIDVRDPTSMSLLSVTQLCFEGRCMILSDVAIDGQYVYLVGGKTRSSNGLGVVNMENPESPTILDRVMRNARLPHLSVYDTTAYAIDDIAGAICAFDLQQPANVLLLGWARTDSRGLLDIQRFGDLLAVTNDSGTIEIFQIGDGCSSCHADTNGDGTLDSSDFDAWFEWYRYGQVLADQNLDANVTPADFSAWVANFNAGCD